MPKQLISNREAVRLVEMSKRPESEVIECPDWQTKEVHAFRSAGGREDFKIDLYRGRSFTMKATHHLRARKSINLVRVAVNTAGHRNPDGTEVGPNHIHLYRQGAGLAWAYPLSDVAENFVRTPGNLTSLVRDFLQYCNVDPAPAVQDHLLAQG
jgi:hypothetical protein